MPEGFLFPYRERFWVPLQARAADYDFGLGPSLMVFGRLRPGLTRDEAQAELRTIGQRLAAEHPETHARLRPDVLPYQHMATGLKADPERLFPAYLMSMMLLVVACGNVGTLTLARTAVRSSELAVRSALGAGRGRIVMQLFAESLVLAGLAAAAALVITEVATSLLLRRVGTWAPFWFDLTVSPFTVALAAGLAVFSAVLAGVLPALKATRRNTLGSLQRIGTGSSGLRFGTLATILIVAEVAIAVGALSGVGTVARSALLDRSGSDGIAAEEYLSAELRLAMDHGNRRVEVEEIEASPDAPRGGTVRWAAVERGFFDALEQPILAGHGFENADLEIRARPVIVNRSFVDQVLDGQQPIGRRVRFPANRPQQPEAWHEIIGVVNDLGMNAINPQRAAGVYFLAAAGHVHPVTIGIRIGGDPAAFVPRLRAVVNAVEPAMLVNRPVRLIAGRALVQLAIGVALGAGVGALMVPEIVNEANQAAGWWLILFAVSGVMLLTGLAACAAPTLRALRIQPTDALRQVN